MGRILFVEGRIFYTEDRLFFCAGPYIYAYILDKESIVINISVYNPILDPYFKRNRRLERIQYRNDTTGNKNTGRFTPLEICHWHFLSPTCHICDQHWLHSNLIPTESKKLDFEFFEGIKFEFNHWFEELNLLTETSKSSFKFHRAPSVCHSVLNAEDVIREDKGCQAYFPDENVPIQQMIIKQKIQSVSSENGSLLRNK